MLKAEVVGSIGILFIVVVVVVAAAAGIVIAELKSAADESVGNATCCSAADFVGEENRLSGRLWSKLLQ